MRICKVFRIVFPHLRNLFSKYTVYRLVESEEEAVKLPEIKQEDRQKLSTEELEQLEAKILRTAGGALNEYNAGGAGEGLL